ncbi:MAG: mycofactocin biosynthesis glycosyltransferase MftF, partial [Actinobacteria bacterium]|nr:mycofactocin biosynthesis glycosyltransferase MftF [Actinomycetota bacterium]
MTVLPEGFHVTLDRGVRRVADGRVLIGGSPIRLLRLTPSGRDLVNRLAAGESVPRSPGAQTLTRRLLDAGLAHPRPPEPASALDVSVVIPVRNDPDGLAATLSSLGNGVSVVVVDDASDDPVMLGAACAPPDTTLLRRTDRGGPAAARNEGWRASAGSLIAFVDANCEPHPGWLDPLLPHFADPNVAAVAPRIVPTAGSDADRLLTEYEAVSSPLDLGSNEAVVRPRSPVAYVPTAALVVRRSALEELGGFDEALAVGEDVDFVWRLVAAGWTVRYEPRAAVRHPIRPDWRAWLKQRFCYGASAASLARRHGWAVAPAVVSPWTAAAWSLAAAGQPLAGAAAAGYSTVALMTTVPPAEAARLAGLGHLRGGLALARAVRRAWGPAAVLLAMASPRSRPALAAAGVVPGLLEWFDRRPRLDPARFVALRLADDLAYAAGVWAGCARERSVRALLPDLRGARTGPVRQTNDPV